MGYKSYLRVDGIRGSSHDLGHVGEMEINTFSVSPMTSSSKSKNVKVSVTMELESSFGLFQMKMMEKPEKQKLKDATLTMETLDQFNHVSRTYKAEMKGLVVIEVSSQPMDHLSIDRKPWPLQKVSFLVDSVDYPKVVPPTEITDEWKAA